MVSNFFRRGNEVQPGTQPYEFFLTFRSGGRFAPSARFKKSAFSIIPGIFLFLLSFLCSFTLLFSAVNLPGDNFYPGWKKSDRLVTFTQADLYNYIDGGAELFLEFGFEKVYVQRYSSGQNELTLEIYEMESPESALGIYLAKRGQETPVEGLPARNSGEESQFTILRERYFIHVNNFAGGQELFPVMLALARAALQNLPPDRPIALLDYLPKENLIKNSERLIRGPYALQPVFTFGEGDILLLEGKLFGVVGNYRGEAGKVFTRILIPYPDRARAEAAYRNLHDNLDPYHKILETRPSAFVFLDYRQKFGLVELKDSVLDIQINLDSLPASR